MIYTGQLLLPAPGRAVRLAPGHVRVEDGRIAEVVEGRLHPAPDAGGVACAILPGFLDAHVHLPQIDRAGIDAGGLLPWLRDVIYPAEKRWADPACAVDMTDDAIAAMRAVGTVAFLAYGTSHPVGVRAALQRCREANVRAGVGLVLMDQQADADLLAPAGEQLAAAEALVEEFPPEPKARRVEAVITPRFAVSCSDELLHGAGRLARRTGAAVQTHLAETPQECDLVRTLHGGRSYLDVYDRAGLLGPRCILGHCIWLDKTDLAVLSDRRTVACHCPTSNDFLASGRMDRAALNAAGVRPALGSDVAGGPWLCMVRTARAMRDTARALGHAAPDATECFWQITAGNADALGWPGQGRIAVGAEADLLVVQPPADVWDAPQPLEEMLARWRPEWIMPPAGS